MKRINIAVNIYAVKSICILQLLAVCHSVLYCENSFVYPFSRIQKFTEKHLLSLEEDPNMLFCLDVPTHAYATDQNVQYALHLRLLGMIDDLLRYAESNEDSGLEEELHREAEQLKREGQAAVEEKKQEKNDEEEEKGKDEENEDDDKKDEQKSLLDVLRTHGTTVTQMSQNSEFIQHMYFFLVCSIYGFYLHQYACMYVCCRVHTRIWR